MGVSTDAILFFGYCWDEEVEIIPEEYEGEWEEVVLKQRGITSPYDSSPPDNPKLRWEEREKVFKEWSDEHRPELDAWYKAKKDVATEFGCEIRTHCSDGCEMPYVFVTETRVVAHRGYPKDVHKESEAAITSNSAWVSQLKKFLIELGIEPPQEEPRWWLVSNWS